MEQQVTDAKCSTELHLVTIIVSRNTIPLQRQAGILTERYGGTQAMRTAKIEGGAQHKQETITKKKPHLTPATHDSQSKNCKHLLPTGPCQI